MKPSRILLVAIWLSATSHLVLAQPTAPYLSQTAITNGEFRFVISGSGGSNCVVQTAVNSGGGDLVWQDAGAVSNMFSVAVAKDGVPHHFRVRCDDGGIPSYSVNIATYYCAPTLPGFSMWSYPLESISSTLSNLLPGVSEGTLLHWHNPALAQMETAQFQFGRWTHPDRPVPRHRAALIWSPPQASPIISHGTFSGGTATNFMAFGLNLVAPAWPTGSPLPVEPSCPDRSALELIGTDGIDPVYRAYSEFGLDWYDDQFNVHPPPFPAFGGLWLQGCGHTWIQTRTLVATETTAASGAAADEGAAFSGTAVVYFNNYVPGFGINARLTHTNGEVASGTDWQAQIYAGPPGTLQNDLASAGDTLPFLSGAEAGYLDTTAGATRLLPGVPIQSNAVAQIRFWDARTGAGYDVATIKGRTPMFLVPTREPGITPSAPLLGLMSPRLTLSRHLLPAAARLTLQGYTGMAYQIEGSTTLSNWAAVATVTNTASVSVLMDIGAGTNQHRFYRATILGPAL